MSTRAVSGLQAIFERVYSAVEQFIDVCPEGIWNQTFGGWPIWQHVYHALIFTEMFALETGDAPENCPLPMDVAMFKQTPADSWSKAEAKQFAGRVRIQAEAYFARLTDENLMQPHVMLSKRFQKDMPQTAAASLMAGHVFYHLGVCDSALREAGLKGIL